MRAARWQTLPGSTVGGRYELQQLVASRDSSAEFLARDLASGETVSVRVVMAGQMLDAGTLQSLDHPNLRVLHSGGRDEPLDLDFVAAQPVDHALDSLLAEGPLDPAAAQQVLAAILPALSYLHDRGLVYMNLGPEAIAQVRGRWVLSAPELARHAAQTDPEVTRLMLTRASHVPPEAFSGLVSPAWDVWSLGTLLRRMLLPPFDKAGVRSGTVRGAQRAPLPEPFETVVRGALRPEPGERMSLAEASSLLAPAARRRTRLYETTTAAPIAPPPVEEQPPAPRAERAVRPLRIAAWGLAGLAAGAMLFTYVPRGATDDTVTRERAAETREVAPPKPEPVPPPGEDVRPANTDRRAAVQTLLNEWVESTRARDAQKNASLYSARLDRFFGRRGVSREQVEQEKARLFEDISRVRKYNISDVRIEHFNPNRAEVSFRKEWDFAGRSTFAGAERARLTLVWTEQGWRILREQELKVYWTRKGRAS